MWGRARNQLDIGSAVGLSHCLESVKAGAEGEAAGELILLLVPSPLQQEMGLWELDIPVASPMGSKCIFMAAGKGLEGKLQVQC